MSMLDIYSKIINRFILNRSIKNYETCTIVVLKVAVKSGKEFKTLKTIQMFSLKLDIFVVLSWLELSKPYKCFNLIKPLYGFNFKILKIR